MKKNIILYFVICYGWSWLIWLPFVLPTFHFYEMTEALQSLIMLAVMLGAFGPLVSAVILTYKEGGRKGLKQYFKMCFNLKVKYQYYLLAIVLSLGITALVHFVLTSLKFVELPNNLIPSNINIPLWILLVPYTLMLFLLGGGQEEFGWRGYVQDPLQEKIGEIKASALIGVFWGLWHLPLWFIQGEGHEYYSFFAFWIYATSWSVTIGIMYNISGKKMIIPWVMHVFANLSVPLFPILILDFVPQPAYWVWAFTNTVVALLFCYYYITKQKKQVL